LCSLKRKCHKIERHRKAGVKIKEDQAQSLGGKGEILRIQGKTRSYQAVGDLTKEKKKRKSVTKNKKKTKLRIQKRIKRRKGRGSRVPSERGSAQTAPAAKGKKKRGDTKSEKKKEDQANGQIHNTRGRRETVKGAFSAEFKQTLGGTGRGGKAKKDRGERKMFEPEEVKEGARR